MIIMFAGEYATFISMVSLFFAAYVRMSVRSAKRTKVASKNGWKIDHLVMGPILVSIIIGKAKCPSPCTDVASFNE
jgi:hypothetical protein